MTAAATRTNLGEHLEAIRFGAERRLAALSLEARRSYRPADEGDAQALWRRRRALLADGMRIDATVDPELHALVERARRTLGFSLPVEVYQMPGPGEGGINASMTSFREVAVLVLNGRLLSQLDEPGQLEVIGHELGHALAHGRPPAWLSTLPRAVGPERIHLSKAFSMARELTADRLGLLVCQDLDAFLRFEMVVTTGLPSSELRWKPSAYLAQCRQLIEELQRRRQPLLGSSHPEHSVRAYAAWLFTESDLYRDLTGRGPGSRPLHAVDRELTALFGLPELPADAPPVSRPAPPVSRPSPPLSRPAPPVSRPAPPISPPAPAGPARPLARPQAPMPQVRGASGGPPSLADLGQRAREGLSALASASRGRARPAPDDVPDLDPLADDERDLIARFDALERKLGLR